MLTFEQLKAGSYYIPVFERIEPGNEFGNINDTHRFDSPYYKYLGDGQFVTESGDSVNGFYDPELGLDVAVDAPDGFIQ